MNIEVHHAEIVRLPRIGSQTEPTVPMDSGSGKVPGNLQVKGLPGRNAGSTTCKRSRQVSG